MKFEKYLLDVNAKQTRILLNLPIEIVRNINSICDDEWTPSNEIAFRLSLSLQHEKETRAKLSQRIWSKVFKVTRAKGANK